MLVNPIDFDLTEDYLHPENFPESGPFFDLHRTKNVTALKGVTTNLVCRVRRLGNHTVIMHENTWKFTAQSLFKNSEIAKNENWLA